MTKTGKNDVTFSHTNNFPAHRGGGVNYLDLIRIIATIMVLTVHLSSIFYRQKALFDPSLI